MSFTACQQTSKEQKQEAPTLKDAFEGKFYIGTALNANQIMGRDSQALQIVKTQFNSIVAENCMKSGLIHPEENRFDFTLADKFVEFGEKNNMFIIGHTLIWHSQAPRWFFVDDQGNDVSRDTLIARMKKHIETVVGRYKGRVKGWDVVNEAILDDGSWRLSKFYKIIGEDFIKLAFQFAHKADPDAELYYNDYSMASPGKREGVIKMVKSLQDQGIRIDAVGMQTHIHLNSPSFDEYEKSLKAFADLGIKVNVTEMDISVLPNAWNNQGADVNQNFEYRKEINPYTEGLPDSVQTAFNNRYLQFFNLYIDNSDKIERVTTWGVDDGQSWLNNWPVRGRTNYPLLFDRNYQPKPVVNEIIEAVEAQKQ